MTMHGQNHIIANVFVTCETTNSLVLQVQRQGKTF